MNEQIRIYQFHLSSHYLVLSIKTFIPPIPYHHVLACFEIYTKSWPLVQYNPLESHNRQVRFTQVS